MMAGKSLRGRLAAYLRGVRAEVGVAVVRDGRVIAVVHDREHYPLMSVMKFYQGLWVAEKLANEGRSVDTLLDIAPEDLHPNTYSPLRDARPGGNYRLSVGELLDYAIRQSDNNASDILFRFSDGPAATDCYLRALGCRHFAVKHTEDEMHRNGTLWAENWTRPSEAASLMDALFHAPRFDGPTFDYLRTSLTNCRTGLGRIAAPLLPLGAVVAHKTGTGDAVDGWQQGINDVAHVTLPDGRCYALAVFIRRTPLTLPQAEAVIAGVSRIVAEWIMEKKSR